jgi:hypothetical protein
MSFQGMTPEEQWRRVSHACTKRYCGCLKRLAGKVSRLHRAPFADFIHLHSSWYGCGLCRYIKKPLLKEPPERRWFHHHGMHA